MIEDVAPKAAWKTLEQDQKALLVDVRTPEEWKMVGYPDLSSLNKEVIRISLQDKFGHRNVNFIELLRALPIETDQPLFFICLSGKRSGIAATLAQEAGFSHVYNVKDGFEGPADIQGKRGKIAGWLADGLPHTRDGE